MVRDEIVDAMIAAMEHVTGGLPIGSALLTLGMDEALAVAERELAKRTRFETAFDAGFGAAGQDRGCEGVRVGGSVTLGFRHP